jgi:hypothetical protein
LSRQNDNKDETKEPTEALRRACPKNKKKNGSTNRKEKMIAGAFIRRRCGFSKDRRRAKNLLHRLNVTEYRVTKKAREILRVDPKCRSEFYVELPFHCDYGYNYV